MRDPEQFTEPSRKRRRRRFDDDIDTRARRGAHTDLTDLAALDERFGIDPDGPPEGDRWSTWDGAEHGPEPRPAWVITEHAAVDTELGVLKTGKEADVHLVERAVPGTGRRALMAAKRYRSAEHRLFHRDAGYLEGRRVRRSREMRAMANRTGFGRDLLAGQWAGAEFAALAGSGPPAWRCPTPCRSTARSCCWSSSGRTTGRPRHGSPSCGPTRTQLCDLWHQLVDALLGLARHGLTHGDLSAYNLLVHDGRLVLIDLPQVVDVIGNPQGPAFLARDAQRMAEWFIAHGLPADAGPDTLLDELHAELGMPPRPRERRTDRPGGSGSVGYSARLDHERPADPLPHRAHPLHPPGRVVAPGLVSEISAAVISALLLRATCHVPEVRLTSPSSRRAQFSANPRSRRSDGGRSRSPRGRSRAPQERPTLAAAPPEVLWTVPETGMPSFAELGLPQPVVQALAANGFVEPFPIQAATLPDTIAGRDLLGRGQTGSGKTLAFGLALLSRLAGGRAQARRPRGLVLVPTRELAQQVVDALAPFAKALGLSITSVVGGLSFNRQAAELQRGIDLLVATPGRLTDHTTQRTCDLSDVTVTAIDEADRMADMGFLPQVRKILDRTPADGQRLLFSATLDGDVGALVRELPDRPGHPLDRLGHRAGGDDGAPRPPGRGRRQAAGRRRDRRPRRAHDPLRAHQARRRPAGADAAPRRHQRRRAARRQGAERP